LSFDAAQMVGHRPAIHHQFPSYCPANGHKKVPRTHLLSKNILSHTITW